MKRNLRFYFALMFARGTALVLKLIGRKGTSMPGSWAIILCPDFIGRMPKPKKIIGITGTNGKTTVSNMIEDVLEDNGIEFMCNRSGTNVATGVASTLIANSHFFGKPKCDLAVFELDERSAPNIYPYMQPDIVLCTNIFRDSYKRNAHAEFILDILNKEIPKGTKLVLNGDDPLCSSIKPENDRVYFGIDHLDTDKKECDNIVNDVPACPKCHGPLVHDIVRYHHIGRVHCEACGYRSPDIDYLATDIDTKDMRMNVTVGGKKSEYPLLNSTNINIYNALAAIATLREFGLSEEKIRNSMEKMGISETRYSEKEVNGRKYILHLAKGQNPMKADRGHVHHRLIDMGFSQKQAVAISYMLAGILGLAAVLLTSSGELKALILIGAIFVVGAIGMRAIFGAKEPTQEQKSEQPNQPEDASSTSQEEKHAEN